MLEVFGKFAMFPLRAEVPYQEMYRCANGGLSFGSPPFAFLIALTSLLGNAAGAAMHCSL